jgi:transketolase
MPDSPDPTRTARRADATERTGAGHRGAPLGCAETAVAFPEAAIR